MARSGFTERKYVCVLCGDEFKALEGIAPVHDPVCMSCGLRWSAEKLKRLVKENGSKQKPK